MALVECDHGQEVRGDLSRQTSALAAESLQAGATSYCNLVEASLAIRSDRTISGTCGFLLPTLSESSHTLICIIELL